MSTSPPNPNHQQQQLIAHQPETADPRGIAHLTAELREKQFRYREQAWAIQELAVSSVLWACSRGAWGENFVPFVFGAYRSNVFDALGQPIDPIERMMVDQMLVAHARILDLHGQSINAPTHQAAALYTEAAGRLMNEFRKTNQAFRKRRASTAPQHLTVVNQQNVAVGDQQIAYVEGSGVHQAGAGSGAEATRPTKDPASFADSELGYDSTEALLSHEVLPEIPVAFQPQAGPCRETEVVEARPKDARRSPADAGSGPAQQAVAPLDGSQDAGRKGQGRGKRTPKTKRRDVR